MPTPLFTEQLNLMIPPGFRETVQAAAQQEGQSVSEFIRSAIRDRLRTVAAPQTSSWRNSSRSAPAPT